MKESYRNVLFQITTSQYEIVRTQPRPGPIAYHVGNRRLYTDRSMLDLLPDENVSRYVVEKYPRKRYCGTNSYKNKVDI